MRRGRHHIIRNHFVNTKMELQEMRRNIALWEFLLGLASALITCWFFTTRSAQEEGKYRENMELRVQVCEKSINEIKQTQEKYDEKQTKIIDLLTEIRLALKDKADRAK